jgi:hypothetical protein
MPSPPGTPTAARVQQLQAGRAWQRMHLAATVDGLVIQPPCQILERIDREISTGLQPISAAVAVARRSVGVAIGLLVLGALPLAIATWWSIVTPVLAILVLILD